MPYSQLSYKTYDDDEFFYVYNAGDYFGDQLDPHPAIRELQEASKATILQAIRKPENVVVKISMLGPHMQMVRGYATVERFLKGATPQQFEKRLGFKGGALNNGCRIYYIDSSALTSDNIGLRYFTSWSAGVSPRDLERLSKDSGLKVVYHRDYPSATDPIPQFVIFKEARVLNSTVLYYGDRLE
jgi:hypothetical protein